jgi:hypothetical protein
VKGKAMSEIEDLKKELQALKDQLNPKPRSPSTQGPIDRTAGMSMDRESMRRMAAVDTSGLHEDLRAFQQQQRAASSPAEPQRPRGTGWVEPRPLESPPGIEQVDRLVDAQDARDRAELIERELKIARMGKGEAG